MTSQANLSRSNRYQKRRNNNFSILFFILLAILFFVILLTLIFSGNHDKTSSEQNELNKDEEIAENSDDHHDVELDIIEDELDEQNIDDQFQNVVIQQVNSDDDNVIEAYVGNWPPIGTTQEEPHTTDYSDGSQDRIEIKRAISLVTEIPESDLIEYWIGNGGEQKVIATVSDKAKANYFRVYLSWVEREGWQVTKVERIKEYTG